MKILFLSILIGSFPLFCFGQKQNSINFERLEFESFSGESIFYEYGTLQVLENRKNKHSQLIDLAIFKLKAKTSRSQVPIVFLSGGPGESGIDYIKEEYFQNLIFRLQKHYDIILLDQRGTGRSLPSLEFKLPNADNREIFNSKERIIDLWNEVAVIGTLDFNKRKIDIKGYDTEQSADDLEDLRTALGVKRLNLLAFSYGTHLALAAAKKYPSSIESMVLIGASGLNHMHHLPSSYDIQLKKISELASKDSLINEQVPNMIDLLKIVLNELEKAPILIRVKDFRAKQMVTLPVDKFGLQLILRLDAGDSNDFIYFPALLYGIENGDYRLLQKYAERRYNQYNGGFGSGIFAMRQASGATPERYERIVQEGKIAILGNAMNTPDIYAGWKNIDLGDKFRESFTSDIRTLFITGTMDSNTPTSNVEEIIGGFSNANHILVQNAGHEDMMPNEEVHSSIVSFFNNDEIISSKISLPVPKFVPVF